MSLSVIIPVYNESKNIQNTINKLKIVQKKIKKTNLIFIDDFSNDNSIEKLNILSKKYPYVKIYKNKKKGLGSAIELGIKNQNLNMWLFLWLIFRTHQKI